MKSSDHFGPWKLGLDPCERLARIRTFRALVRVLTGPRGAELDRALACAETDNSLLDRAFALLGRLGSIDQRKIISSYGALMKPTTPCTA